MTGNGVSIYIYIYIYHSWWFIIGAPPHDFHDWNIEESSNASYNVWGAVYEFMTRLPTYFSA